MTRITWEVLGGRKLGPAPFLILGVVNATPDSFYDGGRHFAPEAALARAKELVEEGADILDIGGESTRPGADPVSADEELARVLPVIKAAVEFRAPVSSNAPDASVRPASPPLAVPVGLPFPVSVDTTKARVAVEAIQAGAVIINDVSACSFDPELLSALVEYKPGYTLMHSPGRPKDMQAMAAYDDVVTSVAAFFETKLNLLVRAGLPESRVVLDPGIGFGKTLEHNLALLKGLDRFSVFGRPIMVGLSNKSLWGALLGLEPSKRGVATLAGTAFAAFHGARLHRVHEAFATRQTLAVAEALA